MEKENVLSVRDFAIKVGATEGNIYALIRKGKLQYKEVQYGGRIQKAVPKSELSKFKL